MELRTTFAARPLSRVVAVSIAGALLSAVTSVSAHGNDDADVSRIGHIIVIYQENWSFDSLYGLFPGADGLANSFGQIPQLDRTASPAYSALIYQTPSPLSGGVVDPQFPATMNGKLAGRPHASTAADSLRLHGLYRRKFTHRRHRAPLLSRAAAD